MRTIKADARGAFLALAAVSALSACGGSSQQESFIQLMPASPDAIFSPGDMVGALHASNSAVIQLSELAAQKASDPRVREYAQSMVDEHVASDGELMTAHGGEANQSLPLVQQIERDAQETLTNLGGHSGVTFDRLDIDHQVRMHSWVDENLKHTLVPATESGDMRDKGLEKTLEQNQLRAEAHLLRARELQATIPR